MHAGIIGVPPRGGLDQQLRVNHLGPFLLTRLLLPALAPGAARRQRVQPRAPAGLPPHQGGAHCLARPGTGGAPPSLSRRPCFAPNSIHTDTCGGAWLHTDALVLHLADAVLEASSISVWQTQMQACARVKSKFVMAGTCSTPRSKLCNVLHALELQRRFAAGGGAAAACAVSPGRVNTQIFDNLPALAQAVVRPLAASFFQTPKQVPASCLPCLKHHAVFQLGIVGAVHYIMDFFGALDDASDDASTSSSSALAAGYT